jgi:predicted RND superfamily exporter protein
MLSFLTAEVAPIADFGVYTSAGILLSLVYTFTGLPALIAIFPIKRKAAGHRSLRETAMGRVITAFGRMSTNYPHVIVLLFAMAIMAGMAGVTKIKFSHDVLRWLPETDVLRTDTERIDTKLKGAFNLEVVIDTGEHNALYDPKLLKRIEEAEKYIESLQVDDMRAGKAWSVNAILKEIHCALNGNDPAYYQLPDRKELVAQELLLFENSKSGDLEKFSDRSYSKARITIKMPFRDAVDYVDYFNVLKNYIESKFPEAQTSLTGMSMYIKTMNNTMVSMARSYLFSIISITLLMILLIGHLKIGLLSMVPNLGPIIIILGIMGWLDISINLFTMMVGSIAIGLVVDDTIHFMHNFKKYYEQSDDVAYAVTETLHTSGRAMLVTSLVLSFGFFIFMLSSMKNLFVFGMLTGWVVIFALLADLLAAPALMILLFKASRKTQPFARQEI